MTDPTPAGRNEFVPDAVLDELKLAFDGGAAVAAPLPDDGAHDPTVELPDTSALLAPRPAPPADVPAPLPSGGARGTIVIGGDDDLPDAVYLDDEVGSAAGRDEGAGPPGTIVSTIVIGDELDSAGAYDAVAVPNRSMDPRVRARRIAVKRAKGRRRLAWILVVVGVVLALVAALAVFSSSLFAVTTVDVQGAAYADPVQLQAVVDSLMGEPVLLVDTAAAETALEQISWVEVAVVRRKFPHSVFVDIRERQPLATFQGTDGAFRVIDRDGRVLDVITGQPVDYMLLTGPAPDTEVGGFAGPPFAAAAQMVSALPAEIRNITESASVDATTGDLGLVLVGDIEVRLGGYDQLDAKLARLLKLVRDGLDGITRIDVSTDDVSVTKG